MISIPRLIEDLEHWHSLYMGGRMQKPVGDRMLLRALVGLS